MAPPRTPPPARGRMGAKVGPLPAWAWGAVLLGVVGIVYVLRRNSLSNVAGSGGAPAPVDTGGTGGGTPADPFPPRDPLPIADDCVYDPQTGKLLCKPAPPPSAPPAAPPAPGPAAPVPVTPRWRFKLPRRPAQPWWTRVKPPPGGVHVPPWPHGNTTSPSIPWDRVIRRVHFPPSHTPVFHMPTNVHVPIVQPPRRRRLPL